jgi:hypothetical protein
MFEWLGLLMVLISWLAGFYLLKKWRGTNAMSISQHAASSPVASKLFGAILLVGGTVFYIWLISWFTAHLKLGPAFTIVLTITFIAQILSGLVSDSSGWKRKVHRIAAYSMAVFYLPLSLMIIASDDTAGIARVIGIVCLVYMLVAFYSFVILKKYKEHYLIAQTLYIICFQIIILSAAYLPK